MKTNLSRLCRNNKPIGSAWVAGAVVVGAVGGALINANAQKKAASAANNLQYQPIDLDALQAKAQEYAKQNAVNSLALEQQLSPGLAESRKEVQQQVADDLSRGGNLPIDVSNQVSRNAITGANSAGFTGAAGPITAASLGTTAMAVRNANQEKAANLLAANPLPVSGLDPGSLASVAVGQNNAENQFNASKVGAQNNANQAQANTWASALGSLGSLAAAYGGSKTAGTTTTTTPTYTGTGSTVGQTSYANSMPWLQKTNYSYAPGSTSNQ